MVDGATFFSAHGTAYHALVDRGQFNGTKFLLWHGAGGGVGLGGGPRSAKKFGATLIAAASSEESSPWPREKGADLFCFTRVGTVPAMG